MKRKPQNSKLHNVLATLLAPTFILAAIIVLALGATYVAIILFTFLGSL
jgi:hypothetical protein